MYEQDVQQYFRNITGHRKSENFQDYVKKLRSNLSAATKRNIIQNAAQIARKELLIAIYTQIQNTDQGWGDGTMWKAIQNYTQVRDLSLVIGFDSHMAPYTKWQEEGYNIFPDGKSRIVHLKNVGFRWIHPQYIQGRRFFSKNYHIASEVMTYAVAYQIEELLGEGDVLHFIGKTSGLDLRKKTTTASAKKKLAKAESLKAGYSSFKARTKKRK